MELNDFKARLKSGALGGCYLFCGEEDYLKKHYLGQLRDAAVSDPALAAFNHMVFDSDDVDFANLTDAVKNPPFMSDFKLVEWRYPPLEKMKESELSLLEDLVEQTEQNGYTVLALLAAEGAVDLGTPKKPSRFVKRFAEKLNILVLNRSTDAQLLSWLNKHFIHEGISASQEALRALIFKSGHSMSVLAFEVDKLCAYAHAGGRTSVSAEDVERVSSPTPESDTFALSNAIIDRNKKAAFLALHEMKQRKLDPIMIIGMMAKTYTELVNVTSMLADGVGAKDIESTLKMNPYKLKGYIAAAKRHPRERSEKVLRELCRMDVSSKFGGIAGYTAIELFISKCI